MALGVKKQDGTKIPIKDVDKEVANFFGTELDDNYYSSHIRKEDYIKDGELQEFAYWRDRMSSNWFDVLGYQIEKAKGAITTWDDAFKQLIDEFMTYDSTKNITRDVMENVIYKHYVDLIAHFKSLGWEPYYSSY